MSDNSPTTKKRKADDGRATVPNSGGGGFLSSLLGYFSGRISQMDRMENMMSRMEEKCSRLETECSSLNHKIDYLAKHHLSLVKHHEYNIMIVKNQSWKYSAPVHSQEHWEADGYVDTAEYLANGSASLKSMTKQIRRGEFTDDYGNEKGIDLEWNEGDPILDRDSSMKMCPHWIEFADALTQFTPTFGMLPDGLETYFNLVNVQLPGNVAWLLKDALMDKPFQTLRFVNKIGVGGNEGMTINRIMNIVESNKHLRKLTIGNNRIQLDHMDKICSAVRHGSIVEIDLKNCFENGIGEEMMTYLLTNVGSKLQRLGLDSNRLNSSTITTLATFLGTNPPLKELDLSNNGLSDDCAVLLANALRSNTSLRFLELCGNTISNAGREAFRLVLYNDSSLNSIADSNHSCLLVGFCWNWNVDRFPKNGTWHEATESFNRAKKIYRLLSKRNESTSTSNVQHFDEIDVKLLPSILQAVQRYASVAANIDGYDHLTMKVMSIVYEVMRKWDKVFPLYTDGGNNDNII